MWKGRDNHGSAVEGVSEATTSCLGNELSAKFKACGLFVTCHVLLRTGQVTMVTEHVTHNQRGGGKHLYGIVMVKNSLY